MDLALDSTKEPTARLARVLEQVRDEYDYIFLDCPPSISLVSESVFRAADALLVPIIPATLSSRTFEQLASLVDGDEGGPQVLAFFSMVEVRKSLHREVMAKLRAMHVTMLGAAIPSADEVERMGEERRVVAEIAPDSRATLSYQALWWDIQRRLAVGR
jgi:cellulose biosynthesis protein BcsQ